MRLVIYFYKLLIFIANLVSYIIRLLLVPLLYLRHWQYKRKQKIQMYKRFKSYLENERRFN